MKHIITSLFIISGLFSKELDLGSSMPLMNHQLADISGKTLTLSDVKGDQGTLVIFSCNTCPWVIRWEDRYVSIADAYLSKGIGMIAVNSNEGRFNGDDSMDEMIQHARENDYNFPYAQDPGSNSLMHLGRLKHHTSTYSIKGINLFIVAQSMIMPGIRMMWIIHILLMLLMRC